jgi:hypothetical protein
VASEPGEPVTEAEVRQARDAIDTAVSIGRLSEEEGRVRKERILHSVTPHDLWRASGGLAGDPRSGNPWSKGALVALVCFVAVAVVVAIIIGAVII